MMNGEDHLQARKIIRFQVGCEAIQGLNEPHALLGIIPGDGTSGSGRPRQRKIVCSEAVAGSSWADAPGMSASSSQLAQRGRVLIIIGR
jgi:hypothetical protein